MALFPPRLHVLLAAESTEALIIRRGPSDRVCFIRWDRKNDAFSIGQWMRGKVYARRSDLSPDGKYVIYFAMNGRWDGKAKGAWTAISKAPYMKAITLLPKGDCWHGGGLFTGKKSYWLNDGYWHSVLAESTAVQRDRKFEPAENWGGECPGVYYVRLKRDGWKEAGEISNGKTDSVTIFEKEIKGGWILRKFAHAQVGAPPGKGCYWDAHELENPGSGVLIDCADWEWAEWDRKRLVWAKKGVLYAGHLNSTRLRDEEPLFDANGMTFQAIAAPY